MGGVGVRVVSNVAKSSPFGPAFNATWESRASFVELKVGRPTSVFSLHYVGVSKPGCPVSARV